MPLSTDLSRKGWFHSLRGRSFLAACLMLLGVLALYCPVRLLTGGRMLFGFDYVQLHMHRIRYARQALLGVNPHLPAWYSRELLGSPFWSNMQNFPFLPTHLPLLLMDPLFSYAWSMNLAAGLAALFTYWYCRCVGLTPLAAAVSGWTFAASGFFASRIMAGHLPLLEAYPSLPLLLWLIEKAGQDSAGRRFRPWLLGLSIASGGIVLAGHPQLPVYALGTALLYLLYRIRTRRGLKILGAIILGIGLAGFVLWPMFRLICRSTRFLPLNPPDNNIAFPTQRLTAFFFPWKDGFPNPFDSASSFTGYPNTAYFWDTVCYIGWAPLLAVVLLVSRQWSRPKPPPGPWRFFITVGSLALITALPFWQRIWSFIPGTILRSPSRQIYVTTFALAVAVGTATDVLLHLRVDSRRHGWIWKLTVLAVAIHVIDLGCHDRHFLQLSPVVGFRPTGATDALRQRIDDGRIAVDYMLASPLNRDIDDVGFFDSVILARPYRAMLDLSGAPPGLNIQTLNGSELNPRALAATGTRIVVSPEQRSDLPLIGGDGFVRIYAVPNPASRASFIPLTMARFLDEKAIHERLRDPTVDLRQFIMLQLDVKRPVSGSAAASLDGSVAYERPSSDVILVNVRSNQDGFLRVLESFDPGWSATVDGRTVPVLAADDFALAVGLNPGAHAVRFSYATPGARTGAAISVLCLPLVVLLAFTGRRHPAKAATNPHM